MALNGIPISPEECIGDSLVTINDAFVELDSRTLTLSTDFAELDSRTLTLSTNSVTQIVAGSNITISPTNGKGIVTINSTGGGGGAFSGTTTATTLTADNLFLRVAVGGYYKYIQLYDINGVYNEPI